jgi:hypothetical protein
MEMKLAKSYCRQNRNWLKEMLGVVTEMTLTILRLWKGFSAANISQQITTLAR